MTDRLLRHPVPYINESIGNYVLRLCSENSCEVNQIADLIGFNLRGIDNFYGELKEKHIAKFSELTGIDIKVIEDMTAKRFRYDKYSDYISLTPNVCPKCYSEGSYERVHWKNKLIKVCLDHEIYLIDECPRCKEKITIHMLFYGKCDCGLLINDFKYANCINENLLQNQNILYQIFNAKSRASLKECNMLYITLSGTDYCKLLYHLHKIATQNIEELNNLGISFDHDEGHNSIIIASWIMNDWPVNLFKFLDTLNCIDIKYINSVSSFEAFNEWLAMPLYMEMINDKLMRIFNPLKCLELKNIYYIFFGYKEIYEPIMQYYYENIDIEKVKIKMDRYIYLNNYVELDIAIKIFFSIDSSDWWVKEFVRDYFHIVKFFDKKYLNLEEIFSFFNKIYVNCSISFSDINEIRSSYTTILKRFKSMGLGDIIQVQLDRKLSIRVDPICFHGIKSIMYQLNQTENGLLQLFKKRWGY